METLSAQAPLRLRSRIQHYLWGRPVDESIIRELAREPLDRSRKLAELWIGSHPKAPASVEESGQSLDLLLQQHPEFLGSRSRERYGSSLPFLFKVLSIGEPLSIQLHPDKATAVRLHQSDPAHYPDDNPKPEIGVALSETKLLYGFRSAEEIRQLLERCPPLAETLALAEISAEAAFRKVYTCSPTAIAACCQALYHCATAGLLSEEYNEQLAKLAQMYPEGEVGVLAFVLLNIVTLQPDEALFIAPNVPHAYLSGEIVECMANSDNVIRAGLTPKFTDVENLLALTDFSAGQPERCRLEQDGVVSRYLTPAEEFSLARLRGSAEVQIAPEGEATLLFCLSGEAELHAERYTEALSKGDAILLPAAAPAARLQLRDADLFRVRIADGEGA